MVEDPPHIIRAQQESRRHRVDFTGLVLVAMGLSALQIVLDKGEREDWFSSHFITILSIICACSLIAFVYWEWRHPQPIVNLRLFKNPSFAVSNMLMLVLGITLFGSTVLIPQFLQVEMGYSAQKAGEVLTPGGFVILVLMPIVGFLVSRVDARYLIAFGFVMLSTALFSMTNLNLNIDYQTAMLWRIHQAAGMAFLFVPINTISYTDMPLEASNQVSGMINLMRNVGGGIGISAATTIIARRAQLHQAYLVPHLYEGNPRLQEALTHLRSLLGLRTGPDQAGSLSYGAIYQTVQRQAAVLAYIDAFLVFAVLSLLAMGLLFFVKKSRPGQAAMAH